MTQIQEKLFHAEVTGMVIGAAMEVHKILGAGFLESVYEESLAREFSWRNIPYERQKLIPVFYKTVEVKQFVCDFLVDDKVIVELKAIKAITDAEKAQVLNYLKAAELKVGLLLNFGTLSLEYYRFVN